MGASVNARLDEQVLPVLAALGLALTSTLGDCVYASFKNFRRCQVIIGIADGTTVTGATITLKQATAVAGTGEKALAFTRMLANTDHGAARTMVETAVSSNTFTTQTTNSKDSLYVIDIAAEDLDVANGFDCFRVDATGHAATAMRGSFVLYNFYGARYAASPLTGATAAVAD
jgi:hypothetical protein